MVALEAPVALLPQKNVLCNRTIAHALGSLVLKTFSSGLNQRTQVSSVVVVE